MRVALIITLYTLFFSYRIYFWDSSSVEFANMSLNALFDTFISFVCGLVLFKITQHTKKAIDWIFRGIASVFILSLGGILLWSFHFVIYSLTGSMETPFKNTFSNTGFQIFDLVVVLLFGAVVTFGLLKSKALNEKEESLSKLTEERKIAELKFLRSQMDPHFIFNTLNTIQYSINKEDKLARKLVNDFSDLFRFHLYEFNELLIPLEKEIAFIINYISILRVRRIDTQEIFLKIEGNVENKLIPPLVMIPVVENSMKHSGNFLGKKSQVDIKIKIEEKELTIVSHNTKGSNRNVIKEREGIGLLNIRKRLDLQYPEQYFLQIEETDYDFKLILTIPVENEVLRN